MCYVVTGGAGFIGSCIVRKLNDMGIEDIIIVDNINTTEKWMNIRNKKYMHYIHKNDFLKKLEDIRDVKVIIHMGACSSTTEQDFDYLYQNNFEYTKTLWHYCTANNVQFLYASSAATYGAGEWGFDDKRDIDELLPLNRYGYSKQLFDLWVKRQKKTPKQYVGMKFFNVYGPNEYAKESMASVIFHGYRQIKKEEKINLFQSYKKEFVNGGQLRDFIYVKDICDVIEFFMQNAGISGIFNVGTGKAETFNTLGKAIFKALGKKELIEYIEMPLELQEKYQYYTQADISKLRDAGYKKEFYNLTDGAIDYVTNYLEKGMRIY